MTEQAISALLGAMGTALMTAVGGLAWIIRQRSNEHRGNPNGLLHSVDALQAALTLHTALLQELVTLAKVHNAEASERHKALLEAMRR